ncbi:CobW/HypB/UreG, nucleotide-binding domain [Dethiosulfatibacter aminovorans DSM 17477]|uniref:CobW/HypB/UreG, nucleotide-binding domain n=1 Tax=Dethiosulfatibacter aminovorans DSM 17477 TaxID=1121476 RepID=A0A1M6M382_9FIRM|nr:GTP-binding protein [Dethiosulfatibacter aminovorans]SHJ77932.1 CobW/HypB/UreG, nucleotide-binding domain [Dethiosulfatibacter aminovorans DSM 17477]
MEILLLSGFLGSGKTTVMLELLDEVVKHDIKVAVVENEIGQIGVDGKYLKHCGVEVQELFGGCICCTLTADIVHTLNYIKDNHNPDLTIIEATGAARPADVVDVINSNITGIKDIKTLSIVDGYRYKLLMKMMKPLIGAQLLASDIVAINKIDEIDEEELCFITGDIKRIKPEVKVLCVSAENRVNMVELAKEIL